MANTPYCHWRRKLRASGWLRADEDVVLINSGAGLKYPEATREAV